MDGFEGALADILERISGAWWVLDCVLVLSLFYYFWESRKELSWAAAFHWSEAPLHIQAAAGILVFHAGDAGVRFLVWWLRHAVNSGASVPTLIITVPLLVFSLIAGVGLLCQLRVFSSPLFGRWVWIGGLVLAGIMAIITRHIPI